MLPFAIASAAARTLIQCIVMPVAAITVENLAKSYFVGHRAERGGIHSYTALRDVLGRQIRNAARRTIDVMRGRQIELGESVEEFWALKDVSFEVQEGEILGIIGRNGAGKSTLLKILSRVTEPTRGRVTLRGRVASLLEVGTGFHPELTGRENIFLNGAILGMSRAEIRRKFDEIVAFAEVERFIDTPVKRYSSGMYVRLAFAVAAHLEPEILIVDEVLAVGDAEFQKKCLGKIDEVSRRNGRTVLFVSHNLAAIAELANRAVLLVRGCVALDAPVAETIAAYLSTGSNRSLYITPRDDRYEVPHIARAAVFTSGPNGLHDGAEPLEIGIWIRHSRPLVQGCLGIQIINQFQVGATNLYAYPPDYTFGRRPGLTVLRFNIPKARLNVGRFHLRIWLTEAIGNIVYEVIDDAVSFEVIRNDRGVVATWTSDSCVYREDFSVQIDANNDNLGFATIAMVPDSSGTLLP
jgi:lipopolysaccharide transport system ATP-binding protein